METKICFKCGIEKNIDNFYSHPKTADKHLNKCKECTKKDVIKRISDLKNNPEWIEREKIRNREKYHRLNYKNKYKQSFEMKKISSDNYKLRYPEKEIAKIHSQHIITAEGIHKHHWSYRKEHWMDIIELKPKEHLRIHCYMIYDQERMMYRALNGELLDNKEKHLRYIESLDLNLIKNF
jgi:hypothetical protein